MTSLLAAEMMQAKVDDSERSYDGARGATRPTFTGLRPCTGRSSAQRDDGHQ